MKKLLALTATVVMALSFAITTSEPAEARKGRWVAGLALGIAGAAILSHNYRHRNYYGSPYYYGGGYYPTYGYYYNPYRYYGYSYYQPYEYYGHRRHWRKHHGSRKHGRRHARRHSFY